MSGGGQTGAVISLQARFYCPLNDREEQGGQSHASPPPVPLYFFLSFLLLLAASSLQSLLLSLFMCLLQPLLSPVAAEAVESQSCALCDGADCRGPYRNHIPT